MGVSQHSILGFVVCTDYGADRIMYFLLREAFKRNGMAGYKDAHHYADIGITAGAGAAVALAFGTDTASARHYFENALFLGGAASVFLAFRTATASEPDTKNVRIPSYLKKLGAGAALGIALSTAPLAMLPGTDGMSLKERILQDNTDYVPLRKRQRMAEKAAKAAEAEFAKQTFVMAKAPVNENVSHETLPIPNIFDVMRAPKENPIILVVPKRPAPAL